MDNTNRKWVFLILILAGIVLGGLIGNFAQGSKSLAWLNYGNEFGLPENFKLNLVIIVLEVGFLVKISVAKILGMLIGILIYKFIK